MLFKTDSIKKKPIIALLIFAFFDPFNLMCRWEMLHVGWWCAFYLRFIEFEAYM